MMPWYWVFIVGFGAFYFGYLCAALMWVSGSASEQERRGEIERIVESRP